MLLALLTPRIDCKNRTTRRLKWMRAEDGNQSFSFLACCQLRRVSSGRPTLLLCYQPSISSIRHIPSSQPTVHPSIIHLTDHHQQRVNCGRPTLLWWLATTSTRVSHGTTFQVCSPSRPNWSLNYNSRSCSCADSNLGIVVEVCRCNRSVKSQLSSFQVPGSYLYGS